MSWFVGITMPNQRWVAQVVEALEAGLPHVVLRQVQPTTHDIRTLAPYRDRILLHARLPDATHIAVNEGFGLHHPEGVAFDRARFSGLIGASRHTLATARAALASGADYVFLSPIFQTSKPGDDRPALGPSLTTGCVALGGVTPERVGRCLEAGAAGFAVQSGLYADPDVARAVKRYLQAQNDHKAGS